jgi:hypothetical protein
VFDHGSEITGIARIMLHEVGAHLQAVQDGGVIPPANGSADCMAAFSGEEMGTVDCQTTWPNVTPTLGTPHNIVSFQVVVASNCRNDATNGWWPERWFYPSGRPFFDRRISFWRSMASVKGTAL